MLVVAALRFVDPHPAVDPLTGSVRASALAGGPSAADRCALEHALRIADALAGTCVAVTVGPAAATGMLRDALAVGAGAALRIADGADHGDGSGVGRGHGDVGGDVEGGVEGGGGAADVSGERTARLLLGGLAATHGLPDVIVCGDRSADRGSGATPAFLAALLGCAQALGLTALTVDGGALAGTRRLDGGRREHVRLSPPAVVSVEPADVRLRRASLPATIAARTAVAPVVTVDVPADPRVRVTGSGPLRPRPRTLLAPDSASAHERMLALSGALSRHDPPRVVIPDTPADAARELLDYLRAHGFTR